MGREERGGDGETGGGDGAKVAWLVGCLMTPGLSKDIWCHV